MRIPVNCSTDSGESGAILQTVPLRTVFAAGETVGVKRCSRTAEESENSSKLELFSSWLSRAKVRRRQSNPGHVHYDWEHDNSAVVAHSDLATQREGLDRRGRKLDDPGFESRVSFGNDRAL